MSNLFYMILNENLDKNGSKFFYLLGIMKVPFYKQLSNLQTHPVHQKPGYAFVWPR